jgi:hypothetical protein
MKKFTNSDIIQKEIDDEGYDAILAEKGWGILELAINSKHKRLVADTIMMYMKIRQLNLYEIYTYNDELITEGHYEGKPAGAVSGWDIKWVLGTDEGIKSFPFFDEIITTNDNSTGRRTGAIIWR